MLPLPPPPSNKEKNIYIYACVISSYKSYFSIFLITIRIFEWLAGGRFFKAKSPVNLAISK